MTASWCPGSLTSGCQIALAPLLMALSCCSGLSPPLSGSQVCTNALLMMPSSLSQSIRFLTIRVGASPWNLPVQYMSGLTNQVSPLDICARSSAVSTQHFVTGALASTVASTLFTCGVDVFGLGSGPCRALLLLVAVAVTCPYWFLASGLAHCPLVSTTAAIGIASPSLWCIGIVACCYVCKVMGMRKQTL